MFAHPQLVAALIAVLLAIAAAADVATRRIPNLLVLAIAATGLASGMSGGLAGTASSLAAALVVFLPLTILWRGAVLGGGDVKLTTAAAFGIGLGGVPAFLAAAAMAGGLVGAGVWVVGRWRGKAGIRVRGAYGRSSRNVTLVPYGVAIAVGGIWALFRP